MSLNTGSKVRNLDPAQSVALPLVVDLDGTLTPTDTLVESILLLLKRNVLFLLLIPFWIVKGREYLKCAVAARVTFNAANLPLRQDLLIYLREQGALGRRIVLATAAHESIAIKVAAHLKIFDAVLASNDSRNLKGSNKLRAIQSDIAEDFVYAGDSRADLPIWQHAKGAILVGTSAALGQQVRRMVTVEKEFHQPAAGLPAWTKALRVHQWAKNLLLMVPLLTGFAVFDVRRLGAVGLAFLAFSLAASATYIFNDLWDLDSDRAHARKCKRPFASARLSVQSGVAVAIALLAIAMTMASIVSTGFVAILLVYVVMTSTYSWVLKQYVLIDVMMLAMLYTLRIFAGSVAGQLPVSSWLLAFSVFLFFSLAIVKRCSELVSLQQAGSASARGRDYGVGDLTVLWPLGVGASLSAVVVFGLFISSPDTSARYASPALLWLTAFGLLYWVGRMWIKTARGEMHDDPIVFALKDRGSAISVLAMLALTALAHLIDIPAL